MLKLIHNLLSTNVTNTASSSTAFSSVGGAFRYLMGQGDAYDQALSLPAYYACVRVLVDAVGTLPLKMHKGTTYGESHLDPKHPLFTLLYREPNVLQTASDFKRYMQFMLLTRGNAYALKIIRGGRLEQLVPLDSDRVTPFWLNRENMEAAYRYVDSRGEEHFYLASDLFILRNTSWDGLQGHSPVEANAANIAHARTVREHSHKTFENRASVGGSLQVEKTLSESAQNRLRDQFNDMYTGATNAGKPLILEDGMKFEPMSMTMKDVELIETYKLTRSEIASIFGVPAHMINDLDNATFSNIEHLGHEFYNRALLSWLTMWEEAISRDLIIAPNSYFAEFDVSHVLRGDSNSRADYHTKYVNAGVMTRNEARIAENLNPIDGLDEPLVPLNMANQKDVETVANETE